jgi:Putative DNA-binding domain
MSESEQLHDLQQNFMNYVLGEDSDMVEKIESTPALSAKGRLDIYATAYKLRLKEAITTDYDKLHSYLGDEQFDIVMERYIEKYPSHITNLRYYSISMTELLRDEAPFNQVPALAELATIEAAFADSFDAEDHRFVTINDLAELAAEAWVSLQLDFQKSVQILPMEYNSFTIWKALSAEKQPPEISKSKQAVMWVLWRRADLVSHYRALEEAEYAALELAIKGENFAVICERLLAFFSEEETPIKAVGFLESWIQEEMLAELKYEST